MQWRTAAMSGLVFCTVVCLLAAAAPDGFRSNQAGTVPVGSQPRDSQNLSSLSFYDPNPDHLWNRLYRQFYVRKGWDGREYGGDVLDPLLWGETHYLITGPSHQQALSVLDEFLSTHGERLITDPVKRAVLQRDLWAVFEWASDPSYVEESKRNRAELERKLAQVMQRLALSPEQIQSIPDTYSVAAAAKAFPTEYNPSQRETTFLPPDFRAGAMRRSPISSNLRIFQSRAFRVPTSSICSLKTRVLEEGRGQGGRCQTPICHSFPRGTQVLLLRRMMLIDREGQLRPRGLWNQFRYEFS